MQREVLTDRKRYENDGEQSGVHPHARDFLLDAYICDASGRAYVGFAVEHTAILLLMFRSGRLDSVLAPGPRRPDWEALLDALFDVRFGH